VQPLQRHQGPIGHPRPIQREARSRWQSAALPPIFPDQLAPIVRVGADEDRELVMARWGMPGPPQFGGAPITNIRNVKSPHWRRWLGKLRARASDGDER